MAQDILQPSDRLAEARLTVFDQLDRVEDTLAALTRARVQHVVRAIAVRGADGDTDYFVRCACGWVSASSVWAPGDRDMRCGLESFAREAARNNRIFRDVLAGGDHA